jgi:transketolase
MFSSTDTAEKARQIRYEVVRMIGPGNTGHYGGSLSVADILAVLYFCRMRYDPADPTMVGRDRLILSKGHAAPAQYAALAIAGFFSPDELATLKQIGSRFQGHPDLRRLPGIEANTGSLGQGLSIGVGMALATQIRREPSRVYVVLGDGELQEGQVWEAAMAAAHYGLDRLTAVVDHNGLQATGVIDSRMGLGSLSSKWRAFGWHVCEADGHDVTDLNRAFDEAESVRSAPSVIIARTVKGKGVSFIEGVSAYHNGALTRDEHERALAELSRSAESSETLNPGPTSV